MKQEGESWGTTVNAESTKWMIQLRSQNLPSVSRIGGVSELLARARALNLLSQQLIRRHRLILRQKSKNGAHNSVEVQNSVGDQNAQHGAATT